MRWSSIVFWGCVVATGAVYGVMVAVTLPAISASAGGLAAFDMRPTGYGVAEARMFLATLDDAGRALYLGAQQRLDTVFPGLLAVTLVWAMWRLTPGYPRLVRAGLLALPVVASGFDYLENARVRALLLAGPEVASDAMIHAASHASVSKAVLSTLAYTALAGLILWRARKGVRR